MHRFPHAQSDPVEFLSWLLNSLHSDLTGGKLKQRSIITDCLQVPYSHFGFFKGI